MLQSEDFGSVPGSEASLELIGDAWHQKYVNKKEGS